MRQRVSMALLLCAITARTAGAATMVTWQSLGELTLSTYNGFTGTGRTPPVGTTYQLQLQFDPYSATPTPLSSAGSNCNWVGVTGSMNLGGYTYGLSGHGFTHAQLPGTSCSPGYPETQFLLGTAVDPPNSPWPALAFGFLELSYSDLLVQDTFPSVPTSFSGRLSFQMRDEGNIFLLRGRGALAAIDSTQPAPVPEPGTVSLLGLGLAAVTRRIRRGRITS